MRKEGLVYVLTREKAPVYTACSQGTLTPDQIRENADLVAEWLAGMHEHRSKIARLGGLATKGISTPKKQISSRENGRRGGRPKDAKNQTTTPDWLEQLEKDCLTRR